MSNTYAKLNDGRVMIIWGEDAKNEEYEVYPISEAIDFDNYNSPIISVSFSDVAIVDSNLFLVQRHKITTYEQQQIDDLGEGQLKIKITSDECNGTNWLNISPEQLVQIHAILG